MLQAIVKEWALKVRIGGVRMVVVIAMTLLTVAEMLIYPMMKYSDVTLEEYLKHCSDEWIRG
jgi:hypothetical protein